ncbi:mCG1029001 [Mus musculus]|nr:mCG1029001 [Mus musculus]
MVIGNSENPWKKWNECANQRERMKPGKQVPLNQLIDAHMYPQSLKQQAQGLYRCACTRSSAYTL